MSRVPLAVLCTMTGLAASTAAAGKDVMLMNRIGPSKLELYVANADGSNEHRLLPDSKGLDYDPSFSADGQWIGAGSVVLTERSLDVTCEIAIPMAA